MARCAFLKYSLTYPKKRESCNISQLMHSVSSTQRRHGCRLTYEHVEAAEEGFAQQGGVGGAQRQQDSQVPLSLDQVHLGEVHNGSSLNDKELDVEQGIMVAHCLKG